MVHSKKICVFYSFETVCRRLTHPGKLGNPFKDGRTEFFLKGCWSTPVTRGSLCWILRPFKDRKLILTTKILEISIQNSVSSLHFGSRENFNSCFYWRLTCCTAPGEKTGLWQFKKNKRNVSDKTQFPCVAQQVKQKLRPPGTRRHFG